jgi:carbonic anhydrase
MTADSESAHNAFERLRAGNVRFVAAQNGGTDALECSQRIALLTVHEPFAIVLACSDARVPVEMVFDQGLGDVFVVRVAGNVVTPTVLGSIEFAAQQLGARLVVVLGHQECGAVLATLDQLRNPTQTPSPNLRSIVDRIEPEVRGLLEAGPDCDDLIGDAVRANVLGSVRRVRSGSPVLERLIRDDGLRVVGAEYSVRTGVVDFFEGAPEAS